jgi:glycosyltransferase involved in cell wall biosynthesis
MKIAVVIATYNGEKYIEEQLFSIYKQTLSPEQVIICDDCSTDATVKLIQKFMEKHKLTSKWHLYINEENLGYPTNFYNCLDKSNAKYCFFSDQDDIWHPQKIEKMMSVLEKHEEINLMCCNYAIVNAKGQEMYGGMVSRRKSSENLSLVSVDKILKTFTYPGMAMVVRNDFYNKLCPVFVKSKIPHDFILALLASDVNSFYYYDFVGVYHRYHDNNVSGAEYQLEKMLNLKYKLDNIQKYCQMLRDLMELKEAYSHNTYEKLRSKLLQFEKRQIALENRKFFDLLMLYVSNINNFRMKSFLGDLWLICFGNYQDVKKGNQ